MLNAIVNGKAGRTKNDIKSGTSWRSAFHGREDLLTASVFERLSYLPGPLLYNLLGNIFGFNSDADNQMVLKEFEFWPRWSMEEEGQSFVEPDAFFVFSDVRTDKRIHIILEAKPHDSLAQYSKQWHEQCEAYSKCDNFLKKTPEKTFFMAIGGLGYQKESFLSLENNIKKTFDHINFVGASWAKLTNQINREYEKNLDTHIQLLLRDILSALSLAGYQEVLTMESLVSEWELRNSYSTHSETLGSFLNV